MEIAIELMTQVVLGIAIIVIGTAIVIFAKFIRKNVKEESQVDEYVEEVGENLITKGENLIFNDDVSSVSIPKKEIKPKKITKTETINKALILISILFLSSCSLFDSAYNLAKDNVSITWKFDESKSLKVIDSINVISRPVYWVTDITEFAEGQEKITIKDGYSIWQLRTGDKLRTEVIKLDSTIYIYKVNK